MIADLCTDSLNPAAASPTRNHRSLPTQPLHLPPSYDLLMGVWRDPEIGPEFHQLIQKYRLHQQQRYHQSPSSKGALGSLRVIHQDVLVHHLIQLFLSDDSAHNLAWTNRTFLELIREKYQLKNEVKWVVVPLQGILTRTSRQGQQVSNVNFMWNQSHTDQYVLDRKGPDDPELVVANHNPFKNVPLLLAREHIFDSNSFIHKDSQIQSKGRLGEIKYLDLELSIGCTDAPIACCLINLTFVPESVVRLRIRCDLRFKPYHNVGDFYWPRSLHTLAMVGFSIDMFCEDMLPTWPLTLQKLTLSLPREPDKGTQPSEQRIHLPPTVTDLDLQYAFPSPRHFSSYVHFPPKLQKLHYGSLSSSLSDLHLSDELHELILGVYYNSPVDGWQMPKHLKLLKFGGHFNQNLECVNWSNELTYFEVGMKFAQDLTRIKFPDSLKVENMFRAPWNLRDPPQPLFPPITSTTTTSLR